MNDENRHRLSRYNYFLFSAALLTRDEFSSVLSLIYSACILIAKCGDMCVCVVFCYCSILCFEVVVVVVFFFFFFFACLFSKSKLVLL